MIAVKAMRYAGRDLMPGDEFEPQSDRDARLLRAIGKAKDADLIMTSGEIARTLGDPGIPVKVISNFTSTDEIDAALRDSYDI